MRHVSSNNDLANMTRVISDAALSNKISADEEDTMGIALGLSEMDKSFINVVAGMIKDEVVVEERAKYLQKTIMSSLEDIDVRSITVEQWNPWDWSAALETMTMTRKDGKPADLEFFMDIFNKIDADGGGTVDEDELFNALKSAGMEVTRDGLKQMIAVVDENGDGEISREEWKNAIEYFLSKKKRDSRPGMSSRPGLDKKTSVRELLGV